MERFLIDVYKKPKSKEAQVADERFKTLVLVHDYLTNEL